MDEQAIERATRILLQEGSLTVHAQIVGMLYHREKETQWQANGDEVEVDRWKKRDATNGKQMEVRLVIYKTDEDDYVTKIEVVEFVDDKYDFDYCCSVNNLIANDCIINRHGRIVDISAATDPNEPSTMAQDAIRFVFAAEDKAKTFSIHCDAIAEFNKLAACSAARLKIDRQRIEELQAEVEELERQLAEESINRHENERHIVTDTDCSIGGLHEDNSDSDTSQTFNEAHHDDDNYDSDGDDNEQF
jgi:hypothetical protein